MTSTNNRAPNLLARFADGFQNVVANLGTSRDKSAGNTYVAPALTDLDLLNAYRGSSVARAVVDAPAIDSCREWRAWQAEADQISLIEAEEKRLGIARLVMSARKRSRLFGGSAIYIGTEDKNLGLPLSPDRIQAGGLKYLTLLDRSQLGAGDVQMDPSLPGYGLPGWYEITGAQIGTRIHPSRLAIFHGDELPDNNLTHSAQGWGDSVLQTALEKVGHLDATVANVAALVFEAKVDVVKIKDFTQNLRDGGTAYENLMLRRFGLAMTAKGINGTLLMDAEEEYTQKTANFSTLPDIMDRFMQMVSAAAEIPMTRLFGMSPGGLNSTGEGDLRNYYDRVKREQTLEIEPALSVLDECLIRSSLGARPEDIHYNWRPLWQLDETTRATNAKTIVEAANGLALLGAAPLEAIGQATVNALTEGGAFPGLESAVEEFTAGEGDDE